MNNTWKKTAAAVMALVCTAALAGCADTGTIMTVGGVEIRNGIYLQKELSACSDARTKASEQKEEAGDTSEIKDLFAEKVDGKSATEWVKEQTMLNIRKYAAVEKLAEKYGITLSNEELASINADVSSMWNEDNYYAQYFYGTDTIGEYYDSIGIGKESLKQSYINEGLSDKLFLHYYDTDGETPVSDEDFDAFLKENYAAVKLIELEYDDYAGIALEDDADIQAVKDKAQAYADRLNGGESFAQIKYENDLENAQNEAKVDAIDSYGELTAESGEALPDYDKYIEDAVNAATAEKAESDDALVTVISKESSNFDTDITDYIWSAADDSGATLFETSDSICVVVRIDVTAAAQWKSDNRTTVLKKMKGDEYDELIAAEGAGYSVESNDYLVNTKYAPDKIKGVN